MCFDLILEGKHVYFSVECCRTALSVSEVGCFFQRGSYCAVSVWYMWQMPRYFWKVITAAALLFLLVNVATVLLFLVGKCGRGPLVSLVHVAAALLPVVEVKHGSCCVVSGW